MTHSRRGGGETKNLSVQQSVFLDFRKGSQWKKKKNQNKKRFMTNNINSSSSAKVHQA